MVSLFNLIHLNVDSIQFNKNIDVLKFVNYERNLIQLKK